MNEVTLPSAPNWFLSTILACSEDGIVAWGSRRSIIVGKPKENSKALEYSFINRAHINKVNSIAFSPKDEETKIRRLVSGGEDNIIKIWNLEDLSCEHENDTLQSEQKVIAVDWSKSDKNLIAFASEDGTLVIWDYKTNNTKVISLGKVSVTCLACCPHSRDLVAVGTKHGLIYIVTARLNGKISYKLRGHDTEICSLSWCPVPENILDPDERRNDFLLASGAKDKYIFIWKGSDGRYESKLFIPDRPLDYSFHRSKSSMGHTTAVCWITPTILLSSSAFAEILQWNLSNSKKKRIYPKVIHSGHGRGLFSIAGYGESIECTSVEKADANSKESNEKTEELKSEKSETDELESEKNEKSPSQNENEEKADENTDESNLNSSQNSEKNTGHNVVVTKLNAVIWSTAQDRRVICSKIENNRLEVEYNIPTQGGYVYCVAACPVDTTQIAFGAGDAMIRLWNLSEPHENTFDLTMMWEKIKGHVRTLAWHPEKENLLAFGTNEGRVGVFDANIVAKPPLLYRQYHRHTVYRVGWGPAPGVSGYALYSCGDGELVYYDPNKLYDKPTSFTGKKGCLEFAWKSDFSIFALGFENGSILFYDANLQELSISIHTLKKAIHHLVWHPESTLLDTEVSSMRNYLAVGANDSVITIFEISALSEKAEENNEETGEVGEQKTEYSYKLVTTLQGHTDRVICLAWSPHISGYLVSGSYDFTAKVWKVETQELIATFSNNFSQVHCCMWSPLNPDLIITGSTDFMLKIWKISDQPKEVNPGMSKKEKRSNKAKKTMLARAIEKPVGDLTNGELTATQNNAELNGEEAKKSKELGQLKDGKKRIRKKQMSFPFHARIKKNAASWVSYVKKLLKIVKEESEDAVDVAENGEKSEDSKEDELPVLLGNKSDFLEALQAERVLLSSQNSHHQVTEIDVWTNNLEENLQNAKKEKRLNDYLLSLSASISLETWHEMCEAYAAQLLSEDQIQKAVPYLLCLGRVSQAIDAFVSAKLFKEAYVLAVARLDSKDPIIKSILYEWATASANDGFFEATVECYMRLGEFNKAIQYLARRKDPEVLDFAAELADEMKDTNLSSRLTNEAVYSALVAKKIDLAKSLVEKYPKIKHCKVHVEIAGKFFEMYDKIEKKDLMNWVKGLSNISLLDTLRKHYDANPEEYLMLSKMDYFPSIENEIQLQISTSHQLALMALSDKPHDQLTHIVKIISTTWQYEVQNLQNSEKDFPSLKFLYILNESMNSIDLIFSKEQKLLDSLHAFYCATVVGWFNSCSEIEEEDKRQCCEAVSSVVTRYAKNIFNREAIKFWTATNEIKKLENQLASSLVENGEAEVDTTAITERLEKIRMETSNFVEEKISTPNPMSVFCSFTEFIGKITDEEKKTNLNSLVNNLWTESLKQD